MSKERILVTGGTGQVGKCLKDICKEILPNKEFVFLGSVDCDLLCAEETSKKIREVNPDRIIHCAALVGGIEDNVRFPANYLVENNAMDMHIVSTATLMGLKRLTMMLSTCIYPDILPSEMYPMTEDKLHLGPPTPTNFSYAIAKRNTAVMIDSVNKQLKTKYNYLIPCNLYGRHDKYDDRSHFAAALVKKIRNAEIKKDASINLLGDGSPVRQFMLAEDLARVICEVIKNDITESFNVAPTETLTIREMAEIALQNVSDHSKDLAINWENKGLNGQIIKTVSNKKMMSILPDFKFTDFKTGIKQTYESYVEQNN